MASALKPGKVLTERHFQLFSKTLTQPLQDNSLGTCLDPDGHFAVLSLSRNSRMGRQPEDTGHTGLQLHSPCELLLQMSQARCPPCPLHPGPDSCPWAHTTKQLLRCFQISRCSLSPHGPKRIGVRAQGQLHPSLSEDCPSITLTHTENSIAHRKTS